MQVASNDESGFTPPAMFEASRLCLLLNNGTALTVENFHALNGREIRNFNIDVNQMVHIILQTHT